MTDPTPPLPFGQMLVFNRAVFSRLYRPDQYGSAFACEMIDLFIESAVPYLDALDAALDAHDESAVRRLLHQFKGSASGMAGASLLHLCVHLEEMGENAPLPEIVDMKMIREAYSELVTALREEQARLQKAEAPS